VLLLTGATGSIGGELLPKLLGSGTDIRALVREPRHLGEHRVDVQISLGDLADPYSMRHALRGVDTVVHLAATIRDQPQGSIEELNGLATLRLLRSAERAGIRRFIFFSAIGASTIQRTRFFRAKALAEAAVLDSPLRTTVFAPSIVYKPGDPWLTLLERFGHLPAVPISGGGAASYEPIWARDVAACIAAELDREAGEGESVRYELAGPEVLTYDEIVERVLDAEERSRPLLHVPLPVVRASLRAAEALGGSRAFATWEEAELMEVPMVSAGGAADARSLGIEPRPMAHVLGSGNGAAARASVR
jgi:uncharacterized protein YbjT (DUF2867 family)